MTRARTKRSTSSHRRAIVLAMTTTAISSKCADQPEVGDNERDKREWKGDAGDPITVESLTVDRLSDGSVTGADDNWRQLE